MVELNTPISAKDISNLHVGDTVEISGYILCGRDAVLPRVVEMIQEGTVDALGVELEGQIIFHTAVSVAGVGPTSSNQLVIENSIDPLSKAGIEQLLGKGEIRPETIAALDVHNAVYAIVPPGTALLSSKTSEEKIIAFPELGMEALHLIKVDKYPAIIGAAHGRSIYEK